MLILGLEPYDSPPKISLLRELTKEPSAVLLGSTYPFRQCTILDFILLIKTESATDVLGEGNSWRDRGVKIFCLAKDS
uniref:Uncharacterized protein n=1 Tax=Arundo donax TaxID=35708 RepID=A0A0A8YL86_ARUDO